MKYVKSFFFCLILALPVFASAVIQVPLGGTASTTLGGILAGNGTAAIKSVLVGTGLSFDGTTLTNTVSASSGGTGNVSTSSVPVVGQIPFWTTTTATPALLSTVATGTLSGGTGLTVTGSRYVIGGSATVSADTGYIIPLSASTTDWALFRDTPSGRITDGTGLTWSSNTLNCDTASGAAQGCLPAADWTTFNNKENVLTFNSPLSRSVNAVSFLFNTGNAWTAHNTFTSLLATIASTTNATTTNFAITSLGTPAGTFLAVDPNGMVIATSTSAGGVTSVTGTANQITSTGGGTPVLSIPSPFIISQASTTLFSSYNGLYVGTTATTTIFGTATSTFGAGIAGTYLNLTGTSATSTFARGIDLSGGCFAVNGTCVGAGSGTVTSVGLSDSNSTLTIGGTPITTSGTLTATLNLANSNIWSALQLFGNTGTTTFSGGIESGTKIAAPYFNATSTTATSTFQGGVSSPCFSNDGANCIMPLSRIYASTTVGAIATSTFTSIPAREYLKVILDVPARTSCGISMQFNADTAANYYYNHSSNFVVISTNNPSASANLSTVSAQPEMVVMDIVNVAANIKKWTYVGSNASTVSAGSPQQGNGVWNNTSAQITSIQIGCGGALPTGTRLTVLGV